MSDEPDDQPVDAIELAEDGDGDTPRRGRRYDWDTIRAEYVEGIDNDGTIEWPILDEVARRNHAHPVNVRKRSGEEGWVEMRALFRRRIETQRQMERSEQISSLGADLDLSALRIARSGLAITGARLQELARQTTQRARAIADGVKGFDLPEAPNTSEVNELARAATIWYDLGTKALGDTPTLAITGADGGAVQVAVDADVQQSNVEAVIGILIEAGVLRDADGMVAIPSGNGSGASLQSRDPEADEIHPPDALS